MEKNTPIYIMIMVGMVALVAIVYMLTKPTVQANTPDVPNAPPAPGNIGISGNVVAQDVAPIDGAAVGRFIFGVVLIGACIYAYRKW